MIWAYDLGGAEPIVRDEPVYDAAGLSNGALMVLGTSTNSGADMGIALVCSYASTRTGSNAAIDAVGILQESTYEGTVPSATYADAAGPRLGKVIINPTAVYRAEYYQGTSYDVAVETSSTTTTIYETLAAADTFDGYWIYFTHNSATAANQGSLRMVTANTTTTFTIPAIGATPSTSDLYIVISPPHAYSGNLSTDSKGLSSVTTMNQYETCTNIRVMQSWIESASLGFIPLTGYKDRDTKVVLGELTGLDKNTKFYSDLRLKDHLYGEKE